MSFTDQLLGSIDERIAAATEQIASLEDALHALRTATPTVTMASAKAPAEAPAPAARTAPAAAPTVAPEIAPAPRRTAARRKPIRLDDAGLDALLEVHPEGLSAAAIAKQSGAAYNQVVELLRVRERDGDVRQSGERRSSLWRLISDEERIAERAAELAARTKAA